MLSFLVLVQESGDTSSYTAGAEEDRGVGLFSLIWPICRTMQ